MSLTVGCVVYKYKLRMRVVPDWAGVVDQRGLVREGTGGWIEAPQLGYETARYFVTADITQLVVGTVKRPACVVAHAAGNGNGGTELINTGLAPEMSNCIKSATNGNTVWSVIAT